MALGRPQVLKRGRFGDKKQQLLETSVHHSLLHFHIWKWGQALSEGTCKVCCGGELSG